MKLILLLFLFVCLMYEVEAQSTNPLSGRHELRLGVGAPSLIAIPAKHSFINDLIPNEGKKSVKYCPSINLSYAYRFTKWFSLGATMNYAGTYTTWSYDGGGLSIKSNEHLFGITPMAHFNWYNARIVRMYSSVGVGLGVYSESQKGSYNDEYSEAIPLFDVTLFGITVGRKLFGFSEVGIGTNGLVKLGIGYRFDSHVTK